jgi:hypothetical protein
LPAENCRASRRKSPEELSDYGPQRARYAPDKSLRNRNIGQTKRILPVNPAHFA